MTAPTTATPTVRYFSGLDLGQVNDPSALAVLEQARQPDPAHPDRDLKLYTVVHLERFPLGTPYLTICACVVERFASPPLAGSVLGVDQTGVGRPTVEILRKERPRAVLYPITITGGHHAHRDDTTRDWHVPKKDLISAMVIPHQARRLKIVPDLKEAKILVKEMQNFRIKITINANETYEAWRQGMNDDLVLAVATACWLGERGCDGPLGMSKQISDFAPGRLPPGLFASEGPPDRDPEDERNFGDPCQPWPPRDDTLYPE